MVDLVVIGVSIVLAMIVGIVGFQEIRMNYLNPLPKFSDTEKGIDGIKLCKTRVIK